MTYLDSLSYLGVGGAHPGGLQLTKKILSKYELDPSTVILDVGCGTGQTAAYIAQQYRCQVIALDQSQLMLEKAKQRFSTLDVPIKIKQGHIEQLPFQDESFDIVLAESVLVFSKLKWSIGEINRVLKSTGSFIAIEMVMERQLSKQDLDKINDFYQFSQLLFEEDWTHLLTENGFTDVQVETYDRYRELTDVEGAPDFLLSDHIDEAYMTVLEQHQSLMERYKDQLGCRVFICHK